MAISCSSEAEVHASRRLNNRVLKVLLSHRSSRMLLYTIVFTAFAFTYTYAHQQQAYQPPPQPAYQQQVPQHMHQQPPTGIPQGGQAQPNLLRDKTHVQDREHIKEHLQGVVNQPDVSKMTEEELQFHYFKMHDNDDNNKLDGCELIKSVLHWHVEESNAMGPNAPHQGTTKIFQDSELSLMIDPILDMDDRNKDGFIDYPEFVAAQKSRGF